MKPTFLPASVDRLEDIDLSKQQYDPQVVEVEGIVSQRTQGLFPQQDYSVHLFYLCAWRRENAEICEQELAVFRPLRDNVDWTFPKLSVRRFHAVLSKNGQRAVSASDGEIVTPDAQFLAIMTRLSAPVVLENTQLGHLTLDRELGYFVGSATWNGEGVLVYVRAAEQGAVARSLPSVDSLWKAQMEWQKRADDFAASQLLSIKNESWEDEDTPLTDEEFISRLTLESITIDEETVTFLYDDGELFFGHAIEVRGTINDGFVSADIPG